MLERENLCQSVLFNFLPTSNSDSHLKDAVCYTKITCIVYMFWYFINIGRNWAEKQKYDYSLFPGCEISPAVQFLACCRIPVCLDLAPPWRSFFFGDIRRNSAGASQAQPLQLCEIPAMYPLWLELRVASGCVLSPAEKASKLDPIWPRRQTRKLSDDPSHMIQSKLAVLPSHTNFLFTSSPLGLLRASSQRAVSLPNNCLPESLETLLQVSSICSKSMMLSLYACLDGTQV